MGKLKIFLSYHKSTPVYKSEIFQPIQVGAAISNIKLDFAIQDNNGENISKLNPYYCELTGHYWVLKNYLHNCEEDYIGFAHYRRLPDLTSITKEDLPSIYGMKYSDSINFFKYLNSSNLYNYCQNYDIICPCSCYMYKNTVNPDLRKQEPHYNVYNHFKAEHNNDCLDILKSVIETYYPMYSDAMITCFNTEKSYFYNIYIMKKYLMIVFLKWKFDILKKTGEILKKEKIFDIEKYKRMAGFIGECIINIWLLKHNNYNIGHMPIYMIDFEADYIEKINKYHEEKKFEEELKELKKLLELSSDKYSVIYSIIKILNLTGKTNCIKEYLDLAEKYALHDEQYYSLAQLCANINYNQTEKVCIFFEKSMALNPKEKLYAKSFLRYAEAIHDIDKTLSAWNYLKNFELTNEEVTKYNTFKKTYDMVKKFC